MSDQDKKPGLFSRFAKGLKRSSDRLSEGVAAIAKKPLDRETLDELEELLIASDLGGVAAMEIVEALKEQRFGENVSETEIKEALAAEIAKRMKPYEKPLDLSGAPPRVVLFVGVNGSGKTTTLGKISQKLNDENWRPLIAAGDTFRAAAVEQVAAWADRTNTPIIKKDIGADAAGLIFDAYGQAMMQGRNVVLADTAGRLQNRRELMEELEKIVRVLKKKDPKAPHEVILVLDATVGQNALSQAEIFKQAAEVSGLVMTKLDGTAKGGVLMAVAEKHDLPLYYIGVGEGVDDLQPFDAEAFARGLVGLEKESA